MFEPPVELLEANLFDFSGDLYGKRIEVGLHHYIRPEMKFDSMEALAAGMQEDAAGEPGELLGRFRHSGGLHSGLPR